MPEKSTYEELEQRIIELKSLEQKHRHNREVLAKEALRYRTLFETANDAILIMEDFKFVECNKQTLMMYGCETENDILGFYPWEFSPSRQPDGSDSKQKAMEMMQAALGNKPQRFYWKHTKKDGSLFDAEVSLTQLKTEQTNALQAIVRDITERKRLEKMLQRSQKMESLGLLASGVAHDLNNVLSGIVSYPDLLLLRLPEDSKLRKPIKQIRDSGFRAAAIVDDLLTIARGVATAREPLNLNDLIHEYLNSPELKKLQQNHPGVNMKTNLESGLFNMSGSKVHIRKVLMNLVSNAAEAIETKGSLTISTMNRYLDKPVKGYDEVKMDEYVVLSVANDGAEISSEELERIFEPFYTKKINGRSGTGLGLAVVWNVARDHEGYIDIESDENGTHFELYFPITREEISETSSSQPVQTYKGNNESILVVDDEEKQRDITSQMLDSLGYKVKAVASGEEAVAYLTEHCVDLMLLDMIMDPGINGRETYQRIKAMHPKQKAIIVSGFAETNEVKKAQKIGAGRFIKKPFTMEQIGIAIRDELK